MSKTNLAFFKEENDEWDEETQKDWEEKMNQPVAFRKITEEELQRLREQKKNNKRTV